MANITMYVSDSESNLERQQWKPMKSLNLHFEKKLSTTPEHLSGFLDFKRAEFQEKITYALDVHHHH
jgi:hypothetical protein